MTAANNLAVRRALEMAGVEFDWVESCGPAVVKPAHRGFGIMVIERNLARELDTHVELAFWAEGVQCKILLPPRQLAAIS